jgi:hypothetical protein
MSEISTKLIYIYGQLFSLAKDQDAAIRKMASGHAGAWTVARTDARTKRIEKLVEKLIDLAAKRVPASQIGETIRADVETCCRNWTEYDEATQRYMRSVVERIS